MRYLGATGCLEELSVVTRRNSWVLQVPGGAARNLSFVEQAWRLGDLGTAAVCSEGTPGDLGTSAGAWKLLEASWHTVALGGSSDHLGGGRQQHARF